MIKVADFGLSRDTYQTDYYIMSRSAAYPVKWMSPEMLRDGISTEKSDVVSCNVISQVMQQCFVFVNV